jgi:hypothetical protein
MSDSESLPHANDIHESSTTTASTLTHPTTHDRNYTNNDTSNPLQVHEPSEIFFPTGQTH